MIPNQLLEAKFNRVQYKEKRAFESGWQKNPYSYDEIKQYIPGENYGVMCGDIRVLDDDTPKKGLIKTFIENFGETFRVRDHLYFRFDNGHSKKIIFKHKDIKFPDSKGGTTNHMGELQGEGTYVVGPGSIHPSGEIYEVKNDLPIKTISYDKFMEVFGEWVVGNNTNNKTESKININDDDLIKQVKENWNEGDRQNLAMDIAGYLRKNKRLGLDSAINIIENICKDVGDFDIQERLAAVRATYSKDEKDIKGVTGLQEREIKAPGAIFGVEGQAKFFIERNPIYYDSSNIWWLWDYENKMWKMSDEIDILNGIRKDGVDTINSKTRTEIIAALKQLGRLNKPKEPTGNWIQFKDKIVDLDNDIVFESTPEYFMTNPLPWDIGESEETPTLDKYFKEWVVEPGLQDESYVDTLYEMISYSAMSKQFLQRLFALVGSGSNGKGVYISIIKKFLGKDNCCNTEMKLISSNNFESSTLYKKQMCEMGEVDAYDMQNSNMIKQLSGENDIRYCFKGKTPFTDSSSTTCFISTNSMPVTNDKSKGYYRRWLIIDFPHEFPVGKDILAEISDDEFRNLSKKVIRIGKELIKRKTITNEGDVEERMKRYEDRSNPMMTFISDNCENDIRKNYPLQTFLQDLNEYLKQNRLRAKTMKEIKKALVDEGFEVNRRVIDLGGTTSKVLCVVGLGPLWTQKTQKDALFDLTPPMSKRVVKTRPSASFASSPQEMEVKK
jgi:putative DNA primase/helicase